VAEANVAWVLGRDLVHHCALETRGNGQAHGGGERKRPMAVAHRDRAREHVVVAGGMAHAVKRDVIRRRGDEGNLRRGGARRQTHAHGGLDANLLQARHDVAVRVDGLWRLGGRQADVARADEHERIGGVDAGGLDAGDDVARLTGREQAAGARAPGLDEVERDPCAAAGHARELEVAVHKRLAVARRHVGDDQLLRVGVVDADDRFAFLGAHDALIDRERPDSRRAVAAVAVVLDDGRLHVHLGERVVDVGIAARGRADDTRLRERRDAAAQSVELPAIGIGTAESRQQDAIARGAGVGQILRAEHETAAGAATHIHGADPPLGHARDLVCASNPPASKMSRSRGVSTHEAVKAWPLRVLTTRTRAPAASEARRSSTRSLSSRWIAS
jgi:hypothetical protein